MGSTDSGPARQAARRDHPHTHGEHFVQLRNRRRRVGSSPYAWGARAAGVPVAAMRGIIPIRMGSTASWRSAGTDGRDHPHTHGEHLNRYRHRRRSRGSSPYAWGALVERLGHLGRAGIIPIRMGSTMEAERPRACRRDHPHTHGEHLSTRATTSPRAGSSPYAWGARVGELRFHPQHGIIPIRMGSTMYARQWPTWLPDHPHTHVEHFEDAGVSPARTGSSPYAWGALGQVSVERSLDGIIPIRMGST